MMEWMEKYRQAPREATALTIDRPTILFLGLTIAEFTAGVSVSFAMVILWDANAVIPFALLAGVLLSWASREYRRHFPARFLQHWCWAMGLQSIDGVPTLFRRRRHKVFGP